MPENIGDYHLFQLCLGLRPSEGIRFEETETDLGGGFGVTTGFGVATGIKGWKVQYPVLSLATADRSITYKGMLLTPAEYLWELFCHVKRTGEAFLIQSPKNSQYYLAKFTDRLLSYEHAFTKLITTGIEFKQVRLPGVTVFDPSKYGTPYGEYYAPDLDGTYGDGDPIDNEWPEHGGSGINFVAGNLPTLHKNVQNGLSVVRFDRDDQASMSLGLVTPTVKEIFIVLKVREDTWTNYGGIFTENDKVIAVLTGDQGTTKFFDFSYGGNFEYRINGELFPESNMPAPMNEFAVVHVRIPEGVAMKGPQIALDRIDTSRYSSVDYGHIYIFETLGHLSDSLEFDEHLITHWNV